MSIPHLNNELDNKLDNWLESAQGRYVMDWERAKIDALVSDLFGYHALQLGLPPCNLLAHNRIPLRQTAGEFGIVNVRCDLRELPFAANSVDLVVLPHALEFNKEPHQILREVERILIPEGQLIISGFNPLSLWGLQRFLPHRVDLSDHAPHNFSKNGRYISVARLKDWLKLLSFEVDRGHFGCYAPPCQQDRWLKRWHFMEEAGDRWWSFAGGVYVVRAVKRVRSMRLIVPAWTAKKAQQKVLKPIIQQTERERHEP